jgi:hypothetical protein
MADRALARLLATLAAFALTLAFGAGCRPGARDYCERYAAATCRFQYQCCNARERATLGGLGGAAAHSTEEECVEELTKAVCAALAVYSDAEQNGRVEWDHAKHSECLQPFEEAANTCDAEGVLGFQVGNEGCAFSDIATGLVQDDETCFITDECAGDESICVPERSEDPDEQLVTAKGTCTPPPGTGDECPDFVCASGLFCDVTVDPQVCAPLKDVDDACTAGYECLSSLCEGDVCVAKRANGEDCTTAGECQSEFCDYFDTFTCQPKQADGEPCNADTECANGQCDFGNGTCGADGDNVTYDICLADEQ